MPGRHITDHQMELYMTHRRKDRPAVAAAKAGFSTATAHRIEAAPQRSSEKRKPRGRRHPDPLAVTLCGQGDREGSASQGWQPGGASARRHKGGTEDGDHPTGRDALVVPVDGVGGGHDAQLREHRVAVAGAEAPSVAHVQEGVGPCARPDAAEATAEAGPLRDADAQLQATPDQARGMFPGNAPDR